ncbi:MAG: NIL domain-containing protein [Planctomycetes bacterium]|nr:NIL domain-containing protein [Planctomycetota bacterium]
MQEARDSTEKRRFFLTFPERLIKQPILYTVSTQFDVIPNILGASISDRIGKVAIELDGQPDKLDAVIRYFLDLGVTVEDLGEADSIPNKLADD